MNCKHNRCTFHGFYRRCHRAAHLPSLFIQSILDILLHEVCGSVNDPLCLINKRLYHAFVPDVTLINNASFSMTFRMHFADL